MKIKKTVKHTPRSWRFFRDLELGPWDTEHNRPGKPYTYRWIIESGTRKLMAVLEVPFLSTRTKHSDEVIAEHVETLLEVEANAQLIAKAPDLLDMLKRIVEKVSRANALRHSGIRLKAEDWAELYQLENEAKALMTAITENNGLTICPKCRRIGFNTTCPTCVVRTKELK